MNRDRHLLPTAARRWLKHSLPPETSAPARIRIAQQGELETRGKWTRFTAEGVYEISNLGFVWSARLRVLPGIWITAVDGHNAGRGWGGAKLLGIISMGRRTGPEVLKTQVVRNLGELPWLPPLALADTSLVWEDLGEHTFAVSTHIGEEEVVVHFEIDRHGDVVQAWAPNRPYDVPGGYEEAPWRYEFRNHAELDGLRVPTTATASFDKTDGPWEYWRGQVTSLTMD